MLDRAQVSSCVHIPWTINTSMDLSGVCETSWSYPGEVGVPGRPGLEHWRFVGR